MTIPGGLKSWFSAAELAELALPGLPGAKRKINELAEDRRWALKVDAAGMPLARPRAGRGGGIEYHLSVLPASAVLELARRGLAPAAPGAKQCMEMHMHNRADRPRDQLWAWFDRQSDAVKAEAKRRLRAVEAVERATATGLTATAAVATVAAAQDVAASTLWNWLAFVDGARADDRLPKLAPRRIGGGAEAQIDPEAWRAFLSDYLRPEKPTLASCWHRCANDYAAPRGLTLPHVKTFQRKLVREVDQRLVIAKRAGQDALRAVLPPQTRTVADLHALELVNIDGHRWDVFVKWPDGRVARPMMVAIQDVLSRKFLSWRIGETESAVQTRLAFADLFRDWGIPDACLLDNGRAFASKWITGGTANRYRFKVREEEPTGLLTGLGVKVHWALPYRGSSKPIERGFRDFCDAIAKHPAFAGAYTGNRPDAKPENYGDKAVPLADFVRIVGRGIAAHNAKTGRRTEAAAGRSFDDAFAESYARHPIRRATAEQLRMALLAADQVSTDRKSGAIALYGNQYWTPELARVAGQKVVVRFDPDDLAGEIHVYAADGAFVATAAILQRTGFLDVASARARARQEAELRKSTRKTAQLQDLMLADELAALMDRPDEPQDETPSPTVVRPVRFARSPGGLAVARADVAPTTIERFAAAEERLHRLRAVE